MKNFHQFLFVHVVVGDRGNYFKVTVTQAVN